MCESGQAVRDEYPEVGPVMLNVRFDVFRPEPGGSAASYTVLEHPTVLAQYGGSPVGVLAACRDAIVADLDSLIKEFTEDSGER